MSKQQKKLSAVDAMAKAKKNSLARKQRVAKEVRQICFDKIDEMVGNGVVSVIVPLNEEHMYWGFPLVKPELEALGYQVNVTEDENSDTPDVEISIEHLK